MRESQFRNKITWFTFVFSILVIWVHSYNSELFLGKNLSAEKVFAMEYFLGNTIAQIAVPGFFMLSGYLFYRNFAWSRLGDKWTSRIKSVLVPFVIWNALYYLGYVIASRIPFVTDVVGRGSVEFSLESLTKAVLHYTYNPVFWYLYQLILLILLAPVLYLLIKQAYVGGVYLLLLLFVLSQKGNLPLLNLDALFYYSAAAYAAIHLKPWMEEAKRRQDLLGAILFLFGLVFYMRQNHHGLPLDTVLYRTLIPASLWILVTPDRLPEAKKWMTYNFFLYATHFAVVRLVNKAGAMVLPAVPAVPFLLYLFMPVIAVMVNMMAVRFFHRYIPLLWRLLNGCRKV